MDMAEKLRWLDEEAILESTIEKIDSEIQIQKKFKEPIEREIFCICIHPRAPRPRDLPSINTQVEMNSP